MIELFYSSSPNVYKVMIGLEELGLPYDLVFVDLSKGEQFDPARLGGAPTAKVPVIRDRAPGDGEGPVTVFESGAILQYLAEKTRRLLPADTRGRSETMQWLFWQMANLGPIGGQFWHFRMFAPRLEPETDFTYPQHRYSRMFDALRDVMDRRLAEIDYLAGAYSIADIACFPWIKYLGAGEGRPNLARWHDVIAARPAVAAAYRRNTEFKTGYERNERGGVAYPFEDLAKHTLVGGAG
ncbi:glutathione S-transferase N-terminal domain-containing protein [Pseudaminobacter sp. 19-2017]|uniref:Glutathione S-transferase N-terminal domain-containing protein n=1 Tax=Pseudaminobacter soli (ex Zhang et al. 2022) TaxID=2831468 RepID=A0A942I3Z4_9HYPH|nr:glutathione S-transferase N-terminal domain-containing protein [Pseudaminobacter soli]MBS3652052.1 glutathione S-transferase N-terminal domain-containing protein [Pseudaminobacter soli]